MVTVNVEHSQKVTKPKTTNPPPIFIKSKLNFNYFTAKINEFAQLDGFAFNISTKVVKLQTFNLDSYRVTVQFL